MWENYWGGGSRNLNKISSKSFLSLCVMTLKSMVEPSKSRDASILIKNLSIYYVAIVCKQTIARSDGKRKLQRDI